MAETTWVSLGVKKKLLQGIFFEFNETDTFESTLKNRLFAFLTARNGEIKQKGQTTTPCDFTSCLLLGLLPVDILSSFLISSDPTTSNSSQHQLGQMSMYQVPSVFGWRPCSPPTGQNPGKSAQRQENPNGKKPSNLQASSLSPWNLTFESLRRCFGSRQQTQTDSFSVADSSVFIPLVQQGTNEPPRKMSWMTH